MITKPMPSGWLSGEKMNLLDFKRSETLKLWERIFRRKELRRLRTRARQLDSLLVAMQKADYMILNRLEKALLFTALCSDGLKGKVQEPQTKHIYRKTYALLKERIKKELRA